MCNRVALRWRSLSFAFILLASSLSTARIWNGLILDSVPVWVDSIPQSFSVPSPQLKPDTSHLNASGYKSVRVVVGEEGTLVQQELRLGVQGEASPGWFVDARLVDEGLHPGELRVTSLQQVDEMYLRILHGSGRLTLGDYQYTQDSLALFGTKHASVGALYEYGRPHALGHWAIGQDPIRRRTVLLAGRDGQRSGYLVAQGLGSYVRVVPGSETVWFNSKALRRGRDYQFEPVGGVLDFLGGIFPSSRDLIRIEYEEYSDHYSRGFAATDAWMRIGPFRMQWAGSRLWADLREVRRRAQDSASMDTTEEQENPEDLRLGGMRAELHAGRLGFVSVEGAVSRLDANSLMDSVIVRDGFAGRVRLYSQENWSRIRTGAQWDYTGSWQDSLFYVGEQSSGYNDWNAWDLRENWELDSLDAVTETKRFDVMRIGFAPKGQWRPWVGWGYRSSMDRWNSERSMAGLDHHGITAKSGVELSQVRANQNGSKKQQTAQYEAEYLQQWVRPFSQGRYMQRSIEPLQMHPFTTKELQLTDGIHYGLSIDGIDATLQGSVQSLQSDYLRGNGFEDSISSVQASHIAEIGNSTLGGNSLLQWKRIWDVKEAGRADMWLSEQSLHWSSLANQGLASHKLGLTRERSLIPAYQKVSPGTGNVLYDSLLEEYVEDVDQGDFIRDGSVPTDSLPWTVQGEVALKIEEWWSPGLALNIQRGLLRDIRLGGRGEWREIDSLRLPYMPPFFWSDLHNAQSGLSQNEGMLSWNHPSGLADMEWSVGGAKEKQKWIGELRERRWWVDGSGVLRVPESWQHSVQWRRELVKIDAPSAMHWLIYDTHFRIRKDLPWDWSLEPGLRVRTSTGASDWGSLEARLWQPSFTWMRSFQGNGTFRSDYSWSWMHAQQEVMPWRVMDGFAEGWTHRVETSFEWTVHEKVQMTLGHVFRYEQRESKPFQKFSGEAKAFF